MNGNEHRRENEITRQIIGAAIAVHKALGPGLLESVYATCLEYELLQRQLQVIRQHALPIVYRDIRLEGGLRLDLFVEGLVIVELKSVDRIEAIFRAQILVARPDQGSGFVDFAASLLINEQDLASTQLVQPTSRIERALLLSGDRSQLQAFRRWHAAQPPNRERVQDVSDA